MLRQLFKNKKAQNTAEYALLIALVVAGVIAMQTYAQRSLQARMRDASMFMADQTSNIGSTNQYEPYYMQSSYNVARDSQSDKFLAEGTTGSQSSSNRARAGNEQTAYSSTSLNGI